MKKLFTLFMLFCLSSSSLFPAAQHARTLVTKARAASRATPKALEATRRMYAELQQSAPYSFYGIALERATTAGLKVREKGCKRMPAGFKEALQLKVLDNQQNSPEMRLGRALIERKLAGAIEDIRKKHFKGPLDPKVVLAASNLYSRDVEEFRVHALAKRKAVLAGIQAIEPKRAGRPSFATVRDLEEALDTSAQNTHQQQPSLFSRLVWGTRQA